ncbi:MAG: mechanosensitive ion channel domain-containing protein [Polyangiaceae bacterium]
MARGVRAFVARLAGFLLCLVPLALLAANAPAFAAQLSGLVGGSPQPASSAEASGATPPEPKVAPDSPRAAIGEFTNLTRNGDYAKAARYLDLSAVDASDGPELAKRLRDVLDRHLWIDPSKLSPESHGAEDDGLATDRDELGSVPGPTGKLDPVVIVRRVDRTGARWMFSATTVASIDPWYQHLENRWLLDRLPKWSLRFGPHELRWWQWLALPALLLCGVIVAFVVTRLSRIVVRHVVAESSADFLSEMRGPAMLAWTIITSYTLLPWLGLYEPADAFVRRGFSAALLIALFWALWKAVELSQHTVSNAQWARNSTTASSLLTLGARLGKFIVGAFAFVAVLAELGYPVTSIITGLGIGGIALALAAQKTVENLFGAFSLAIDQPFREGDVIQVDGISGTVETIGLRSTRIRTVDRTLITIPNGKLADMRVETITARDRLRFYCVIGVAHSPAKQITAVLHGVETILRDSPMVAKDSISVRLIALTDSAMNLEVVAMVQTSEWARFLEVRQGLLLGIVEVVDQSGTSLAHPVSSIRLTEADQAQLKPPPPAPR